MAAYYGATTRKTDSATGGNPTAAIAAAESACTRSAIAACESTPAAPAEARAVSSTKSAAAVATAAAHGCVATAATASTAMASRVLSKSRCAHGQQGRKRTDEKSDFSLHDTYSDAAFGVHRHGLVA
jgi:hypothetical protein